MPLTVTVSVSTGMLPPLKYSVKVIVPVSSWPLATVAESVNVGAVVWSVTLVELGVAVIVTGAGLTVKLRLPGLPTEFPVGVKKAVIDNRTPAL